MVVPFFALLAIIVIVAIFILKNSKTGDKGNTPG